MNTRKLIIFVALLCATLFSTNAFATTMSDNSAPVVSNDKVTCTITGGNKSIRLSWDKATDDATPQSELTYHLIWATTDGNLGAYEAKDITSYEITDIIPCTGAYIWVSVTDGENKRTFYQELGIEIPSGVWIGNTQISYQNKDDVLNDGTISYDPITRTLTLNNANFTVKDNVPAIAVNFLSDIKIHAIGLNYIESTKSFAFWTDCDARIYGNQIRFRGAQAGGRLGGNLIIENSECDFTGTDSRAICGLWLDDKKMAVLHSKVTIETTEGSKPAVIGCERFQSEGVILWRGLHDPTQKEFIGNGKIMTKVSMTLQAVESYFYLGNTSVTNRNCSNIFEDGDAYFNSDGKLCRENQSASYNHQTKTLYLNGVTVNVKESGFDNVLEWKEADLTIDLKGENIFHSTTKGGIAANSLNVTGTGSLSIECEKNGITTNHDVILRGGCELSITSNVLPLNIVDYSNSCQIINSTLQLIQTNSSLPIAIIPALKLTGSQIEAPYQYNAVNRMFVDSNGTPIREGAIRIVPKSTDNKFDVNRDGSVNAADVVSIYNYVSLSSESGILKESADINQDGLVNATDVISIYNYIISGN